jgi:hypothetical protein
MTIADWLVRARITDDPAGDLIADMRGDRNLRRDLTSLEGLRAYLRSRNACHEATRAARICLPAVSQLAGSAPVQATWLAPCSHTCSHAACMLPASFLEAACSHQALPHGREQEAACSPSRMG